MRRWSDSIDPATIPDAVLTSEWARRNAAKRRKIKRRYDFLQRLKANREIDRCRKMSHDELMAYLQAKYAEEK